MTEEEYEDYIDSINSIVEEFNNYYTNNDYECI